MKFLRSPSFFLIMIFACSAEAADSEPIVRTSDPYVVTHRLKIGNITVGFSDQGGGYLNYLDTGDGKNIVSARYGRGWQGSVRDALHSGRYNPTQAGFRDLAGTPVRLIANDKRVVIQRFNLPLYGDPVFDFTEHEDLAPDAALYRDGGKRDTDGLDESGLSQDDELRSEFDFEGVYEDASAWGGGTIPILRFYSRYIYARSPKAMLQFGKKATLLNGNPVIDESARVEDVSALLPGKQTPDDTDLSGVIYTAYGIRLLTESGYTTPMWRADGEWHHLSREAIEGRGNGRSFAVAPPRGEAGKGDEILESQFLLYAKGSDPEKSPAIGVFAPQNATTNAQQVLGLDRESGEVLYSEDRRDRSLIMLTHVIPTQLGIRSRFYLTGLLAPDHGKPEAMEALQHETFVLFGTPNEILKSVRTLEKRLTR